MQIFNNAQALFLKHQKTLSFSALAALTAGCEHLFHAVIFSCPCNSWNMLYGLAFLLVPAIVLFLLSLLLSIRSRWVFIGFCALGRLRRCNLKACILHHLQDLCLLVFGIAVVPFTWISVALLQGSFYTCAASGSFMVQKAMCQDKGAECFKRVLQVPCDGGSSQEMQDMRWTLQAQSQVHPLPAFILLLERLQSVFVYTSVYIVRP